MTSPDKPTDKNYSSKEHSLRRWFASLSPGVVFVVVGVLVAGAAAVVVSAVTVVALIGGGNDPGRDGDPSIDPNRDGDVELVAGAGRGGSNSDSSSGGDVDLVGGASRGGSSVDSDSDSSRGGVDLVGGASRGGSSVDPNFDQTLGDDIDPSTEDSETVLTAPEQAEGDVEVQAEGDVEVPDDAQEQDGEQGFTYDAAVHGPILPRTPGDTRKEASSPPRYITTNHPNPLLEAVAIGAGRTWVPWTTYEQKETTRQISGVRWQWEKLGALGTEYYEALAKLWQSAMPPYTEVVKQRIESGSPISRKRERGWESVVDSTGLTVDTHISKDSRSAWEQIRLCPPDLTIDAARKPETYQLRDGDPELIRRVQRLVAQMPLPNTDERGAAEVGTIFYRAFMYGMKTPTGLIVPNSAASENNGTELLIYSPGEPMEILDGRGLADQGYFPGDWSGQTLKDFKVLAATSSVIDANVWYAIQTTGPQTLWEACADLTAISYSTINNRGITDTARLSHLENLWSRGLRKSFSSPPVDRAYVVELSGNGRAQVVICYPAEVSWLNDAVTGDRLEEYERRPARVQAQWMRLVYGRYRVEKRSTYKGDCDTSSPNSAFAKAVDWLHTYKLWHEGNKVRSEYFEWVSGDRGAWIPVDEWVEVTQPQAWSAFRDPAWSRGKACESGVPIGWIIDGVFQSRYPIGCTEAQLRVMAKAAADAPEWTTALSTRIWHKTDSWLRKTRLSLYRSPYGVLGCRAQKNETRDESVAQDAAGGPGAVAYRRAKRPWPPGLLGGNPYHFPHPPCPGAQWPPEDDRYWWPESQHGAQ